MIVWAWASGYRGEGVVYFAIGLAFSTASMISSAGTTLWFGDAAGLQARKVDAVASPVLAQAEAIERKAVELSRLAQELSGDASLLSTLEAADGGTCLKPDGKPSAGGPGPLTDMRARHGTVNAEVSGTADAVRQSVGNLVRTFKSAEARPESVQELSSGLAAVLSSAEMTAATRQLGTLLRDLRQGWVDTKGTEDVADDTSHTCPPASQAATDYLAALATLQADWVALVGESIEPGGRAGTAGVVDGFSVIVETLTAVLAGQPTDGRGANALWMAFVVELAQVLIVLSSERKARKSGRRPSPAEESWVKDSGRNRKLLETEAAVAEVIDQREILVGGKRMMAVQEPPLPEEKLAINLRGLRVEKPEHEGVPVEMLAQDAGWFEPRRHIFGKARAVTLYPLPPETDLWKRQVAARVHALAAASRGKAP